MKPSATVSVNPFALPIRCYFHTWNMDVVCLFHFDSVARNEMFGREKHSWFFSMAIRRHVRKKTNQNCRNFDDRSTYVLIIWNSTHKLQLNIRSVGSLTQAMVGNFFRPFESSLPLIHCERIIIFWGKSFKLTGASAAQDVIIVIKLAWCKEINSVDCVIILRSKTSLETR